jgi:Zn-dependent protease with chaperone function
MLASDNRRRFPWCLLQAGSFALALTLLAGCETMPKGMPSLPTLSRSTTVSPSAELPPPVVRAWPDAAQDVLNQRARGFGLVNAPELQAYLNSLYVRIKNQAGVADWPGSVHILASDALQAYATGAGNIYIAMPWLTSVQSEDELVALLSHEFGHIYLHYHELEGAVQTADTATGVLALGVAVTRKTAQATGWNEVDSLVTAYTLGRGLVTTVYGRSQESAADNFGLNVSLKLGYSYEHGMKAFLERLASWEDDNEQREKGRQEEMLQTIRQQAQDYAQQQKNLPTDNNRLASQWLARSMGDLSGNLEAAWQKMVFDINKVSEKFGSNHPQISERIDALSLAVTPFPDLLVNQEPATKPLQKVLQDRRTAAILNNYAIAFKVINAPKEPKSLDLARKAATGPTASHAVPLFALYTVLNEQRASAGRQKSDPGQVLEGNFLSEPDRAWITYQERSKRLQDGRQIAAARKVMDQGLGYFQNAEEAWPDAIRFYGEVQGWEEAKRMATSCGKNFRRMSARCTQAAASPAEQKEAERKNKEKADQLAKKLFKTP